MGSERPTDDNVIPFPVKFAGDSGEGDPPPEMEDAEHVRNDGCRHRQTIFDKRARVVTCKACGVNVDVFEVLSDVVAWIRRNEWRYFEMQRAERTERLAEAAHLRRVVPSERNGGLLIGRCRVSGYHVGPGRIATEDIAAGDYVSENRVYRARRADGVWSVVFFDPAHGLKPIKTIERPSLTQVRDAVRKHWLWLNNNAKAAGLA